MPPGVLPKVQVQPGDYGVGAKTGLKQDQAAAATSRRSAGRRRGRVCVW